MFKIVYGGYSIKFGKNYLNFPKAAPWIVFGFSFIGLFNNTSFDNNILFLLGFLLSVIGIFGGFLYGKIFKKQAYEYSEMIKMKYIEDLRKNGIDVPDSMINSSIEEVIAYIKMLKNSGEIK